MCSRWSTHCNSKDGNGQSTKFGRNRLGYVNRRDLIKCLLIQKIEISDHHIFKFCALAKIPKVPVPRMHKNQSENIPQSVFLDDVWPISASTIHVYRYFTTSFDNKNSYTAVVSLIQKNGVLNDSKSFLLNTAQKVFSFRHPYGVEKQRKRKRFC